ncbi:MAG: hypothetical protein K9W42_08330 [Candidatus Heimdallarchaeota archaeon]|nr:hypothetical protein [Candidatus Heimdallarchaeota archaeon]
MSQNIDKVKVQIPGTMYYLQLTADRGRWLLALLLRNDIENELIVPVFSKNGILKVATELLNNTRIQLDKYPLMNVCDQLFNEAERSLPVSQAPPIEEVTSTELEDIKQKLDLLETTVNNINEELKESITNIIERLDALENERVARLEAEISSTKEKGQEEIISNLASRVDKIEESFVQTKGDERVPSILTAIEALESKITQLEGKTITSGESGGVAGNTLNDLQAELGKINETINSILQRLAKLEGGATVKSTSPPNIEGADSLVPPTTEDTERPSEG